MKKTLILASAITLTTLFSCTKSMNSPEKDEISAIKQLGDPINPDEDDHEIDPNDPDGLGGQGSTPNSYTGSSNCTSASYTVKHLNELKYSISFNIQSGAIQNLNFTHSFVSPAPTSISYQFLSKNAYYDSFANTVTVQVNYIVVTKSWIGPNSTDYIYSSEYRYINDVINLCSGTFTFSN